MTNPFINSLFTTKLFVFEKNTLNKKLKAQIISTLVEMTHSTLENQFLHDLAETLTKANRNVIFTKGEAHANSSTTGLSGTSLYEKKSLLSLSSQYYIRIDNQATYYMLSQSVFDEEIKLEPISFRRALGHELIHLYHLTSGIFPLLAAESQTLKWYNGPEQAAITGQMPVSCALQVNTTYSENNFAKLRNESERICYPGLNENDLELANESRAPAEPCTLDEHLLVMGLLLGTTKTVKAYCQSFDSINLKTIIQSLETFSLTPIHLVLRGKIDSTEDKAFAQTILSKRKMAYTYFINFLKHAGLNTEAHAIANTEANWNIAYDNQQTNTPKEDAARQFIYSVFLDTGLFKYELPVTAFDRNILQLLTDMAKREAGKEFLSKLASRLKSAGQLLEFANVDEPSDTPSTLAPAIAFSFKSGMILNQKLRLKPKVPLLDFTHKLQKLFQKLNSEEKEPLNIKQISGIDEDVIDIDPIIIPPDYETLQAKDKILTVLRFGAHQTMTLLISEAILPRNAQSSLIGKALHDLTPAEILEARQFGKMQLTAIQDNDILQTMIDALEKTYMFLRVFYKGDNQLEKVKALDLLQQEQAFLALQGEMIHYMQLQRIKRFIDQNREEVVEEVRLPTILAPLKEHPSLTPISAVFASPKNQLLELAKQLKFEYCDSEAGNTAFITIYHSLQTDNFAAAVRQATGFRAFSFLKLILRFKQTLAIDVDAPSSNGNTPLDWANGPEKEKFTQILMQAGASKKRGSLTPSLFRPTTSSPPDPTLSNKPADPSTDLKATY